MDNTLAAASAIAGLLSLTVQITQATQGYISRVTSLSYAATSYLEELVCLKKLLADAQDALLFQSQSLSMALPRELGEFHAEMEQLCERLRGAQRNRTSEALKSLVWPFRDDETAQWASSLGRCRHCIQAAIVLSGLRLQLMTLEEVRIKDLTIDMLTTLHLDLEAQRLKILDWISDDAARRKHRKLISAHHPNTGQWIFATPEFQSWTGSETRVFWCYGNPGVGKTQIMSLIADYLSRISCVAYFYCDYQASCVQAGTAVAASLLRQLVETEPSIPLALEDMYKTLGYGRDKLKLDDITSLLHYLCLDKRHVYILLDALDEYGPASQRRGIMSLLNSLAEAGARILIISRPHVADVGRTFGEYIELEVRSDPSDIRSYVEHTIGASDELAELIDDDLREEAVQRVVDQADRMFLLATLQCTRLTHLTRRSEVRRALKVLPSGLETAYEESMRRIELESPERKSIAMTALSWIYHTKRPLSIDELLHVLAVDSSASSLSGENIPSRSLVVDVCAGLIVLDTESGAVRFAHYSLHEYFQATYQQWFPLARREIARVCLAYLGLENMACGVNPSGEQLAELLSSYPLLRYTAQYWGIHVKDGYDRDMEGLALKFLQNYHRVAFVAQILDIEENNGKRDADMHPCSNLPVQLAARFGARAIVQLLLEQGHDPGATDATGRTALHWAARGGFSDVVRAILREGVDPNVKTIDGRTPLHWAAKHGHSNVIADLLRSGANPAEQTRNGRSALHWAASRGHQSVVEILLSDDRVDAGCQSQNGWTALHWAACSGNRAVVIHGAKYSSENNLPISREWLSMNGGESKGHEEVATLLLETGVSPHVRNEEGQTAVHWAAASRNGNIIRLLRERGAEMDVQDIHGRTPLDFAVDNGAEDALLAMLSTKVNAENSDERLI